MKIIPTKTPKSIKVLFPKYTWDFYEKKEKKIYLTFDDGPIPEVTEFVLDQLQKFTAKATFFCIGDNIQKHPTIFKKIIQAGHSVGNHTMNHLKARNNDFDTYLDNISACEKKIEEYILPEHRLFRPPYGQLSKSKLSAVINLEYKIILWDVVAKDWDKDITPQQCTDNVINNTKEGSIIVFHDSIKAQKNLEFALPKVLEHFSKEGFIFDKI